MTTGRDRFYFPPPEVVDSTPVDKAATIFEGISYQPQAITDSLIQGYSGGTSTGHNTSDLSSTMANVDNRITELEGGGVRFTITSSTTIDVSAYSTLKVILIGSSQPATYQSNTRLGQIGGRAGGYCSGEITTEQLAALGFDLTAVPVTIGTASGQSYLGTSSNYAMRTIVGRADKGDRMGADATTSGPGKGGNGGQKSYSQTNSNGDTTYSHPTIPAQAGESTPLADGGLGGEPGNSTNLVGYVGENGGVATINGPFPCGGAGGGGGGAGTQGLFGITGNGADGGHGGFPGGGPGGGGAPQGGSVSSSYGNNGASGAVANGVGLIDAA